MLESYLPALTACMEDGRNTRHSGCEYVGVVVACFSFEAEVVEVGFAEVEGDEAWWC